MSKLIIANWKMNPETAKEAVSLARDIDSDNLVIAPPFPFLAPVSQALEKSALAAQDVFWEERGAFTGEVSALQLASLGVKYVIIGHSERRRLGDTDEIAAKKLKAAIHGGLIPILCVGETHSEHDVSQSKLAIERQLKPVLELINSSTHKLKNLIIVYEPVWAISTEPGAKADTPENAAQMIKFIKQATSHWPLATRMIYGGSVTAANAERFLKNSEIEGALVGGASLKKDEIKKIIKIAMLHE